MIFRTSGKIIDFLVANGEICQFSPISKSLGYANIYHMWAYGVVVIMFDFHRSDRGSNPGRGGEIS